MSLIDIVLIAVVLIAAIMGAVKGFVHQAGTIVGVILAVLACRFWGGDVADMLVNPADEYASIYRVLVYALVFAAVFIIVRLIAMLFGKVLSAMSVRFIDRLAGAIFSAIAWTLIMSIVLNVYLAFAPSDRARFDVPNKPWRSAVVKFAPQMMGYISTPSK